MTIQELAVQWLNGLTTNMLDQATAEKFIIEATREYQAWGFLGVDKAHFDDGQNWQFKAAEITPQTELSSSEWGVIKPLAELFAERETALMQESSRLASHEPFGRSSSEIQQEIAQYRQEYLRKWAFNMPPVSI